MFTRMYNILMCLCHAKAPKGSYAPEGSPNMNYIPKGTVYFALLYRHTNPNRVLFNAKLSK